MHIKNIKVHAASIAIICCIVLVIYSMNHKNATQQAGTGPATDRYIQIDSATWGRNCDPYVADAIKAWQPPKDLADMEKHPRPHRAADDNALVALSSTCNGKPTCKFTASSKLIGDEPVSNCIKRLVVRYRCYLTDRLATTEVNQNDDIKIDCTPKTPDNAKPANAPAHAQ